MKARIPEIIWPSPSDDPPGPGRPARCPVVLVERLRCPHCGSANHRHTTSRWLLDDRREVRRACLDCGKGFVVIERDSAD